MFDLIISPPTIRTHIDTNHNTTVLGKIYFQLSQDAFFPEEHWDDCLIILLNKWIQKAIAYFHGSTVRCIVMESSYHHVMQSQKNLFLINFLINTNRKYLEIFYETN